MLWFILCSAMLHPHAAGLEVALFLVHAMAGPVVWMLLVTVIVFEKGMVLDSSKAQLYQNDNACNLQEMVSCEVM